jgi:hypothetical protein
VSSWSYVALPAALATAPPDLPHSSLPHSESETYVHVACLRCAQVATCADRKQPVQTCVVSLHDRRAYG